MSKKVLDMCCGSRMFWFDKEDDRAVFLDQRSESHILSDGRELNINPDVVGDFTNLPFDNNQFKLVVFDPPHLEKLGVNSWLCKKYGKLLPEWRDEIAEGFKEAFRVLESSGVLIFKWNETQIKVSEVLSLTEEKPLFGHITGKHSKTHWITFIKKG
jgi:ubiquinone/menaquinone biosynthesis C-methylase UbiE